MRHSGTIFTPSLHRTIVKLLQQQQQQQEQKKNATTTDTIFHVPMLNERNTMNKYNPAYTRSILIDNHIVSLFLFSNSSTTTDTPCVRYPFLQVSYSILHSILTPTQKKRSLSLSPKI